MKTVAALFVDIAGPYAALFLPDVEVWDVTRDARKYAGPHPVVAHPPCERWGKYWSGGPSAKVRRKLGDDNGCFEAALRAVRTYGGVIEHPAYSHAWKHFGIARPPAVGGWVSAGQCGGFTCHVEQGHYGHKARKGTWLYACSPSRIPNLSFLATPGWLPELMWGPAPSGVRIDEGFHSTEERRLARARARKPLEWLSRAERIHTPIPFRDLLLSIARSAT